MSSTVWVKGELIDSLDPVAVDPRQLLADPAHGTLFERPDWFARTLPLTGSSAKPLVARSWTEGAQCWLFLSQQPGRSATALASWYSFAFAPILRGPRADDARMSLLRAIARRLRQAGGAPVEITLAPVPRRRCGSGFIRKAFSAEGWLVLRHQSSTSWTADVAGKSFADYWAARPSQLRNTHDRKAKKFCVETQILTSFDEDAWAAYESVYAESWKPREGDAACLRQIAETESKRGHLRLALARLDGAVVAAQFWTVENGTAFIHKLAHRESAKPSSAGTILSAALFRHVIDGDRVETIDFGTGNDAYKADWMDKATPLDTVRLYNARHPLGLWRWARARISALVHGTRLD